VREEERGGRGKKAHLLNSRNVRLRDVTTDNDTLESSVLARRLILLHRLDSSNNLTVLTRSSRLLLVRVGERNGLGDRLAEGDAGLSGDALDVVLATHALDVDVKVKLTHAGDDGLRRRGCAQYEDGNERKGRDAPLATQHQREHGMSGPPSGNG
jgi:hypothetical protein